MLTELGSIARVAELQRPRPRMYSRPHVGCSRSYMLHVSRCYMHAKSACNRACEKVRGQNIHLRKLAQTDRAQKGKLLDGLTEKHKKGV